MPNSGHPDGGKYLWNVIGFLQKNQIRVQLLSNAFLESTLTFVTVSHLSPSRIFVSLPEWSHSLSPTVKVKSMDRI
jgi:hypothetical protein